MPCPGGSQTPPPTRHSFHGFCIFFQFNNSPARLLTRSHLPLGDSFAYPRRHSCTQPPRSPSFRYPCSDMKFDAVKFCLIELLFLPSETACFALGPLIAMVRKGAAKKQPAEPAADAACTVQSAVHLDQALANILKHPLFNKIASRDPLTFAQGASAAPFNAKNMKASLANGGPYKCGGNFFWQSALQAPIVGVQVRSSSVKSLRNRYYKTGPPKALPHTIVIAVPNSCYNTEKNTGQLPRLSPCEYIHAVVLEVAHVIEQGGSDEDLRKWVTALLSAPFEFRLCPCQKAQHTVSCFPSDERYTVPPQLPGPNLPMCWTIPGSLPQIQVFLCLNLFSFLIVFMFIFCSTLFFDFQFSIY